jgi:hypothetical protein
MKFDMLFFKSKQAEVDQVIYQWVLDHFEWAIGQFNPDFFFNKTTIIEPTPAFFPAKIDSVEGYVKHILEQLQQYTGTEHWPFVMKTTQPNGDLPKIAFDGGLRGEGAKLVPNYQGPQQLEIPYQEQQINDPTHYIAYVGQMMSQYLMAFASVRPPGEAVLWQKNSELLAIVLGLGLLVSNSAYEFKGGCSSCVNPNALRPAQLPENDCLLGFAVYCNLKDLSKAEAIAYSKKHLKKHLRSDFKAILNYVYQEVRLAALKQKLKPSIGIEQQHAIAN